ncbi:hypothetical protein OUZ56_032609 [Daphnia magna]|uniref:Uncharacterized protein n=1 Tax=Daphnia magna TaxID=35525 RepID=A0ABR0B9E1_9CRUS|nr:hypothetical protein OUZ56_032609 [Daphnia magna]
MRKRKPLRAPRNEFPIRVVASEHAESGFAKKGKMVTACRKHRRIARILYKRRSDRRNERTARMDREEYRLDEIASLVARCRRNICRNPLDSPVQIEPIAGPKYVVTDACAPTKTSVAEHRVVGVGLAGSYPRAKGQLPLRKRNRTAKGNSAAAEIVFSDVDPRKCGKRSRAAVRLGIGRKTEPGIIDDERVSFDHGDNDDRMSPRFSASQGQLSISKIAGPEETEASRLEARICNIEILPDDKREEPGDDACGGNPIAAHFDTVEDVAERPRSFSVGRRRL